MRDGACSSSTLKEAASRGKVSTTHEQMVFGEATVVVSLNGSNAFHRGVRKTRKKPSGAKLFEWDAISLDGAGGAHRAGTVTRDKLYR